MTIGKIIKKSILSGVLMLLCVEVLFAVVFVIPTRDDLFAGTDNFLFLYVVAPTIALTASFLVATILTLKKR